MIIGKIRPFTRRSRRTAIRVSALLLSLPVLVALGASPAVGASGAPSGQRAWGQSTVEPAINDANGMLIFLNTPNGAPLPSKAAEPGTAPLYLPVYPPSSAASVEGGGVQLNCHPDNCDHANILPGGLVNSLSLSGVYPVQPATDPSCAHFDASNGNVDSSGNPLPCAPLLGHDHLVGVPPTGDWNVAWDVHLIVFTSVPTTAVRTLDVLQPMLDSGAAIDVGEIITFNCSRVPAVVYDKATPLSF